MHIVLIRPDYSSSILAPYLGLAYLSSALKQRGFEVTVIDNRLHHYSFDILIKKIQELNPGCIGISCLSSFYKEAAELCLKLKELNFKVIMGGVHPSFMPYTVLNETNCDYAIAGEGEKALSELLLNDFNSRGIKGVYKKGDLTSDDKAEYAECIENLDELPFPDWDSFNPKLYPAVPHGGTCKKMPIGIIMTSRGCYGSCTFCASPAFYRHKVRFRSIGNVIEEIELLKYKYGVKEIHFMDDNLIANSGYASELFNRIIEKKLVMPYHCSNGVRADSITKELASLMKKAGCYQCAIGIESADNEILKSAGKNETIEQIDNAVNILHEAGIMSRGNFIFGLPGETRETMEKTINYAVNSKLDKAAFYVLDVMPGSILYRRLHYKGALNTADKSYVKPNWLPDNLSSEDIEKALSDAYKRFYSKPSRFFMMMKDMKIQQYVPMIKRLFNMGVLKNINK